MRNQHLITLAASAAALAFATPALAQSAPSDEKQFDGFYVGATLGYDVVADKDSESVVFDRNLDGKFDDTVTTAAAANAFSPGFCPGRGRSAVPADGCIDDGNELSYSGKIGFDKQFGHIVVGAVAEVGTSDLRDSVTAYSTTPARYTLSREIDYNASVRARVGGTFDRTLIYATGGPAYAKVKSRFSTTNTANLFTVSGDKNAWGYVAGAGIEQKITPHVSVGLEYLYNQYKDDGFRVRASAGTAPATNPFILAPNTTGTDFARSEDKFKWHSIRVALNYRF